ncbi:Uncharacterised protein [Metamycoplasma cloacale]|uniref:hypothetical protein n=1 Tax=Metamycoplasma cloacale TaxID=92401 RepID=UPI001004F834|nr:hypothetical protein [Metamycoplasma cloacale]VEU79112.1 Uncharacterised protein [Metamycoplasma cloacale]
MSKNSKWTKLLFPILTISSLPLISVACDRKDKPVTPTPEPQPEPNPNPSNPEQPVNPNPTPEPQPEPEIPVNPGTDIDENNAELLSKKKQELWDLIEEYNNLRQEYFRLVGKLSIENEKSYPYYSLKILIGDPKLSEVIEAYEGLSKTKEALLNDIEPLKTRGMLYYLNELSNLRSKLLYNKYILMEYEQDVTKYDELLNVYYEKTSSTDFWEISAYYTNVDLAAYEAERQATKVKIEWYSSKKLAFDELMNNLALLKSKYIEHNYLDDSFDDVENITWNDKESRVDVLNKISDLEEKYNKLNDRFERLLSSENEIRNTLIEKIKPSLANYEAIVPNLDILSIDNNNISAYVKNLKTGDDSVVIKDISIDENDNHILNITYGISYYIDTKREFTITKQIIFNKDIQPKLDAIVYENLDELFDINYDKLSQSYLSNLRDDIEQLFIKKHNIVNKYFEYMMDIDSIQYRDNKIFADIQFINKNKVLKTITLSSNQTVSFLDEATKNIRFNFSDEFKASQYYLNGMESSNRINYYLLNFVNPEVQRLSKSLTFLNLVNNGFEGEQILTYDEKIDILNRFLKSFVQLDSTSHINQEAIANWEITNIDNEFIYKIDNSSNTLKFAVLVTSATGAQYKSHIDVRSKDYAKIIEDSNNEKEILKLISSSTAGNIFKTFEYDEITNSDVIASVGYAHFNEIFRLPRHGRYALVLQPKYQPKIDDVKGTLTLKFTYTKDGVVVNQNNPANISKEFTLSYFKPLTADDIYPKNSNAWFTDADFTGYEKPPVDIQNKINSINGTDFEYNLTDGKKLIDVDILLKQKAFNKLRYLFNFTGEIAKTDENNGKFGTDGFNKETEIAPTINKEKIHLSTDKENRR